MKFGEEYQQKNLVKENNKLRILFICGCLEMGKDGVGDYTRKLAKELLRLGHDCSIASLMDKFVNSELKEKQEINNKYIDTFRLPFISGIKKNTNSLILWVNSFSPDWISLQYVPFSFNNKGLPYDLSQNLKPILKDSLIHLMIHEPGMGISKISPIKHKIIGFLQFGILRRLIKENKIKIVTTSNKLYQLVLLNKKINSEILTLFSNIEFSELNQVLKASLLITLFHIDINERIQWKIIGIFGTLYPDSNIQIELEAQLLLAEKENKKIFFFSFGKVGNLGLKEFEILKSKFNQKIKFVAIGEVTAIEASHYVQLCDLMISCTPAQHKGKSGVYAFLKLHTSMIVLPKKEILPEYDLRVKEWYDEFDRRPPLYWGVEYIAKEYLRLLNSN